MRTAVEIMVFLLVAVFLALSLTGQHRSGSPLRDYFVERGREETGALNLVTAIYLGYRAYDTLGETIVLLLAVSGVMVLLERKQ
jgi:multicomponent Na+:H+ antiporter subunit B